MRSCYSCVFATKDRYGSPVRCDWRPEGWPDWAVAELRGGWGGHANRLERGGPSDCQAYRRAGGDKARHRIIDINDSITNEEEEN